MAHRFRLKLSRFRQATVLSADQRIGLCCPCCGEGLEVHLSLLEAAGLKLEAESGTAADKAKRITGASPQGKS